MTPFDLAMACKASIENPHRLPEARMIVSIVLPREPRGPKMRLAGPGSPLGEVATFNAEGHTVCLFDAIEVLAWLAAKGAVSVEVLKVEMPR